MCLIGSCERWRKDINQSLQLGVNAYVVKPGSYQLLGQLLRRLCDFWLIDNVVINRQ
jgi:two-component system response regulator